MHQFGWGREGGEGGRKVKGASNPEGNYEVTILRIYFLWYIFRYLPPYSTYVILFGYLFFLDARGGWESVLWNHSLSRPSVHSSVTKFSQKKFFCVCVPNLGPAGQNDVFYHFPEFGSLLFFEIAYNDSLRQYLSFSIGNLPSKKKFFGGVGGGANLGQMSPNRVQN